MKANLQKIKFVVSILVIVGFTFFAQQFVISNAQAADKVMLRLHWKLSSMHIPFIVAMDKGFYKQEGIDITIKEGAGSTATLKLIGAGKETFGIAGTNVTVKGVARGVPVLQIMVIEASKQPAVLSKPEAGIREPKDLIGKRISGSGAGTSDIFEAFLAANKIPLEKVTYLAAGRAKTEAWISGRADGTLGNAMDEIPRFKRLGVKSASVLLFSDWGIPVIGDGVITNLDTVKNNPEMIRRFVKASIRGIKHTFINIENAVDIAVKHFPMADKDIIVEQLEILKWLFPIPLGWQDPKVVGGLREITAKFSGLPEAKDMPLSKFFTNEFLPKY